MMPGLTRLFLQTRRVVSVLLLAKGKCIGVRLQPIRLLHLEEPPLRDAQSVGAHKAPAESLC